MKEHSLARKKTSHQQVLEILGLNTFYFTSHILNKFYTHKHKPTTPPFLIRKKETIFRKLDKVYYPAMKGNFSLVKGRPEKGISSETI